MTSIAEVLQGATATTNRHLAVACPHDADTLSSVLDADARGVARPILVGDSRRISEVAQGLSAHAERLRTVEIVHAEDSTAAAAQTVELVRNGRADLLMKGLVETKTILKAVLKEEAGLRTNSVLSHAAIFELPAYPRLLLVADAAMIIAPTGEEKRAIILNTLEVARAVGIETPRVAILCAKEKVDPKMPCTEDAAALAALSWNACHVEGPLALDNAVSGAAAGLKGLDGPVAGKADVLIAPTIEAGNILYKTLAFLASAKNAGIIVGAKAPVVLTSRADSRETKLASIALAVLHAAWRRQNS